VDLEAVARGFGIINTIKVSSAEEMVAALSKKTDGPLFIHALAVAGSEKVPNISIGHMEIKDAVREFLRQA